MAEFESIVDYNTVLDDFEGPLDLLLFLVKKEKIEIKNILVSSVTEQFVEYVENMPKVEVDKVGEYLTYAAKLVELKSNALLPVPDEELTQEGEELIRNVEEYKLYKEAIVKLKERENVDRFYKEPDKTVGETKVVYSEFNVDALIKAYFKLMMRVEEKRFNEIDKKEIPKEVFSVKDKVDYIRSVLLDRGFVSFLSYLALKFLERNLLPLFKQRLNF